MALTRASLLKRALVGGVAISFGKLPEQLAQIAPSAPVVEAFPVVRITNLRTAIPSAARLANVQHVRATEDSIALLEPNASPLIDLMQRQNKGQLGAYTAQRVEWLEDELVPRYSDVLYDGELGELTVSEPRNVRYFVAGDVVRNEHSGDLLYVEGEVALHTYQVRHIGASEISRPIVDPEHELRGLAEIMPAFKQVQRSPNTEFGDAPAARKMVRWGMPFEDYEHERLEELNRMASRRRIRTRERKAVVNTQTNFAEWSRRAPG